MKDKKTILVVDDDVHIRRIIEFKLSREGYTIITAADGKAGLDMIRNEHPDAVVTDIMMPRMTGIELCKAAAPIKRERPFLTVMMTARISPDDKKWAASMPDTVFMEKPFSPSKLTEVINAYFKVDP